MTGYLRISLNFFEPESLSHIMTGKTTNSGVLIDLHGSVYHLAFQPMALK